MTEERLAPGDPQPLSTHRLSWSANGRLIVDGIDCTAPAGAVTGLLGPNGSGKSTVLRLIAGVLPPADGDVTVGSGAEPADLLAMSRRARARLLAFVEQDSATDLPISVLDAVLLGRIPHRSLLAGDSATDHEIAVQALDRVGMSAFADRVLTTLSGGERQRVHLARALAQDPRVLLLDEPTNHLDIAAQLATMSLLTALAADGVTVFTALHDLNLAAATCDHLVLLQGGHVVAAGPARQVLVPAIVDEVYGVQCDVLTHPRTGRPVLTFSEVSATQKA